MNTISSRVYALWIHRNSERLNKKIARFKYSFFRELQGTVVEIGPGSGANARFLPTAVTRYVGVEPNPFLRTQFNSLKSKLPIQMECVDGKAERLPLSENFANAVICTFVLCSVSDQNKVLAEVLRVLKPGCPFLFVEHIAAPAGSAARFFQNIFTPLSCHFCGGCEWNRDTLTAVRKTKFSKTLLPEPLMLKWRPLGPVICGKAYK